MSGFMLVADLHFGMTTHDGPDIDGSHSWRENEAREVAMAIRDAAVRLNCPVVVAGDLFDNKRPPAWAYNAARLIPEGHIIGGNHDTYESASRTSPLAILDQLERVPNGGSVVELEDCSLVMVPWFGRGVLAGKTAGISVAEQNLMMENLLADLVAGLVYVAKKDRPDVPVYVISHMTVAGAAYSSGTQPMLGEASEFIAPINALAQAGVDGVFLGHVHKQQTVVQIHYVGGALRHDFGDEDNPTQAWHIVPGKPIEAIDLPARRFVTIRKGDEVTDDLRGCVVRFKGELPAGEETASFLADLQKRVLDVGALKFARPAVTFTRHEAREIETFAVENEPERETLRRYLAMTGHEPVSIEAMLSLHDTVEREVVGYEY